MGEELLYPDQFKSLIEEKIRAFRGRKFVFAEFDKFLKNQQKGYFTVIGDAGMGKSAMGKEARWKRSQLNRFMTIKRYLISMLSLKVAIDQSNF